MEKLVVNLETAILADELGFDESTLYTYIDHECEENTFKLETVWEYTGDFFADKDHIDNARNNDYRCYLAPFRDQLRTWVRDKYNVEITIYPIFGKKCGYDSFKRKGLRFNVNMISSCQFIDFFTYNQDIDDLKELECDFTVFDKYEKALDKALHKALEYIKSIKNEEE